LVKRGIQNEVMEEVYLQDQGGVCFPLKIFSCKCSFSPEKHTQFLQ
jgi:hypothetical protein